MIFPMSHGLNGRNVIRPVVPIIDHVSVFRIPLILEDLSISPTICDIRQLINSVPVSNRKKKYCHNQRLTVLPVNGGIFLHFSLFSVAVRLIVSFSKLNSLRLAACQTSIRCPKSICYYKLQTTVYFKRLGRH